jgi:hypothetical protein
MCDPSTKPADTQTCDLGPCVATSPSTALTTTPVLVPTPAPTTTAWLSTATAAPTTTTRPTTAAPTTTTTMRPERCDTCTPDPGCNGTFLVTDPDFYDRYCCGRCGPNWLEAKCRELSKAVRREWANRHMCIVDWDVRNGETWDGPKTEKALIRCDACIPESVCRAEPGSLDSAMSFFNLTRCCGACKTAHRWRLCENTRHADPAGYRDLEERGMCPLSRG